MKGLITISVVSVVTIPWLTSAAYGYSFIDTFRKASNATFSGPVNTIISSPNNPDSLTSTDSSFANRRNLSGQLYRPNNVLNLSINESNNHNLSVYTAPNMTGKAYINYSKVNGSNSPLSIGDLTENGRNNRFELSIFSSTDNRGNISVKVTDMANVSRTITQSILEVDPDLDPSQDLLFSFNDFSGVNFRNVKSIELQVELNKPAGSAFSFSAFGVGSEINPQSVPEPSNHLALGILGGLGFLGVIKRLWN